MSRGFVYGMVWRDFALGFCIAKIAGIGYEEYDVRRRHDRLANTYVDEKHVLREILNERAWTDDEAERHGKLTAWSYLAPRVGLVVSPERLEPLT